MKTLILIDVQNDFMSGGPLEVPSANEVIPVINKIQVNFDLVLATQYWHPKDHKSFASNHFDRNPFEKIKLNGMLQTLWPDHCIQGSEGAKLHKDIDFNHIAAIFRKGMDREIDSYSGFYDNNHTSSTGLSGYLKEKAITEIHICGLAADICVYYTILDSILEGFSTVLVEDASRPLYPDKFDDMKCELAKLGVHITTSDRL